MTKYIWLNKNKGRYYKIIIQKDMLDDLILTCVWGSLNNKLGNYTHTVLQNLQDASDFIEGMKARRAKRGYVLEHC
jgi:predicted DNA-binding WGR domain protein